jgi:hypothetical protein
MILESLSLGFNCHLITYILQLMVYFLRAENIFRILLFLTSYQKFLFASENIFYNTILIFKNFLGFFFASAHLFFYRKWMEIYRIILNISIHFNCLVLLLLWIFLLFLEVHNFCIYYSGNQVLICRGTTANICFGHHTRG